MGQTINYSKRDKRKKSSSSSPNLINENLDENNNINNKNTNNLENTPQPEQEQSKKQSEKNSPNNFYKKLSNFTNNNKLIYENSFRMVLSPKTNQIYDDYVISRQVLGLGISGKVLCCTSKTTQKKYALKVSVYL